MQRLGHDRAKLVQRPAHRSLRLDHLDPQRAPDMPPVVAPARRAAHLGQPPKHGANEQPPRQRPDHGRVVGAVARRKRPQGFVPCLFRVVGAELGGEGVAAGVKVAEVVRVDDVPGGKGELHAVLPGQVAQGGRLVEAGHLAVVMVGGRVVAEEARVGGRGAEEPVVGEELADVGGEFARDAALGAVLFGGRLLF